MLSCLWEGACYPVWEGACYPVCGRVHVILSVGGACKRSLAVDQSSPRSRDCIFLFYYLNGLLSYVQHHIIINKNVTFPSFLHYQFEMCSSTDILVIME